MAGPSMELRPDGLPLTTEPRGLLGHLDAVVTVLERGTVTFSLLAMALTYFYDIVHVEMSAEDNAFVRLVYRLAGYSAFEQPPASFQEAARTWIGPVIVGVGAYALAWFGVYTADRERRRFGVGAQLGLALVVVAALYGAAWTIEVAPSRWVCIGTYLLGVVGFAVIYGRQGRLIPYLLAWVPASAYILTILWGLRPGYSWAQDLSKILIMWVGFVGASMATHERKHIRIDFVRKAIPERFRSYYNGVGHLVTVVFCALLLVLASWYLFDRLRMGATLASIDLKVWLLVLPIPLALAVMVVRFSARMVAAFRGLEGDTPEEIH